MITIAPRPEMLTPKEAAECLRRNPETIRRMVRSGELRAVRVRRRILIPRSEIDRLTGN